MLGSLGPTRNVDRLASDQPPIRFAVNGITLIYGPNAAGKSGYCRIAKQLCRSLSPVALRGNVFDEAAGDPPEVDISFRVGGEDDQKTDTTWVNTAPPPPELARISVFDTASARVYVDKKRTIEFLPYELDILNKLGIVCRSLEKEFKDSEDALDVAIRTPLPTGYTEGTSIYETLAELIPATGLDDLPSADVLRNLGEWTDEHQTQFDAAELELKNDPQTLLRLRREAKAAVGSIKDEVQGVVDNLSDEAIEIFRQKQQNAIIKSAAAEASAKDLFKDEPISEVGSEVWRQMLLYAREFATITFPERDPPQISTAEICVLCQQDLEEDATERLAAFDAFIVDRAAQESATAATEFTTHQATIQAFSVQTKQDVETMLAGYAALIDARKENAAVIVTFLEKAAERLEVIKRIVNDQTYDDLLALEPLPDAPIDLLEAEIVALDQEIAELEGVERDEDAINQLAQRRAELADRKKLNEEIETIVERRNVLEKRLRIINCKGGCRLTAITRQITERRRDILTPSLKKSLDDELITLRLTHLPLNLADHGQGGESIVEVALSAQQRIANNSEVLSEGEQRALALACFLAELGEIGSNHGIIVDDPVSSLDHTRMEAVAGRLAKEAAEGRQVIVFTHNILFHHMLVTEARRAKVACHQEWMSNVGNDRFGIIDDSQKPWQMKPVSTRIQEIDQACKELGANGYDHTDETFRDSVVDLYTKKRTTWERIVEEVLFNKVVQRFRPEIMTQRLEEACVDPENDYPLIFEGMKRCSHYSGHDLAEDLPPELPPIEEIVRDLQELQDFATVAIERRKVLRKARKYEDGVEPILI